ncbi:MAG: tRNA (N(6)-L-threonylcarbamoyladenosine(37)-C(2))-methylthiotransferase [Thaumarchaeota archaeon]|jgi:MiaB-like tRNA modifying enzyme|nr:tRNA (N(6)-L-threonylcarbamoyladenosine(37)-C(2))-methylthiotransferase [Candidatus Geocrenenecus arthurdayi]MCL7391845.1 tRNA (N(6)-L-threonylcarbamoyladenosine(37)-C(2))-methylthiotransferase [Candidatus Geocrenenecus arthurdayi]MCL7404252.1 tRNA (N(6)-L-threonylcarbamoyladenosine(37)-C(2))-methylthiotransferase [Candidatus Geocrenenecus arthurdayi]
MGRVYTEIYGCTANVADGEIALGILREAGWEVVDKPEDSDLILLVTCTVKKPTSDRMLYRIKKLKTYRKMLIVAGCMASGEGDKVKRIAPEAILVHPRAITRILEVVETRKDLTVGDGLDKLGKKRLLKNSVVGIVPVSEGCRWGRCGFCIVPFTRGRFVSHPLDKIMEEASRLISMGVKEIWLTSQDMGSYGLDLGRNMLPQLVNSIASLPGEFWIRIGMMNPIYLKPILRELAEAYLHPKVYKFLHLPVQSGSDKILRAMNRGYTTSTFREIIEYMKSRISELTVSTDIIVGYPGEDEEDFEETIKLIREIEPDSVNISKFFPRPHTPSEKLPQLDPRIIKERSRYITKVATEIAYKKNLKWIGWTGVALVDEIGEKGEAIARNIYYKPIVLKDECGHILLGRKIEVEVVDAKPHCLIGKQVKTINYES